MRVFTKYKSAFKKHLPALLILLTFSITLLYTQEDYGETWDEWEHISNGKEYYSYLFEGGPEPALYKHKFKKYYGPCMDIIAAANKKLFYDRLAWLSQWEALHLHSLILYIIGGALIYFIIEPLYGRAGALFCLGCFILLPRLLGHSHNNIKDFPVSMLILCAALSFWQALHKISYAWALLAAFFTGLAVASKINGFLLVPLYFAGLAIMLFCHSGLRKRYLFLFTGLGLILPIVSILILLMAWPWLREAPLSRLQETVNWFRTGVFNGRVLYMGKMIRASKIPWHYPLVYILITIPLGMLPFFFIGIVRSFYEVCHKKGFLLFTLIAFLLPLIAVILGNAPKYDGMRQFLAATPFLAILSGLGIHWVWSRLRNFKNLKLVASFLTIILFIIIAWQDYQIHPYQTVFFNGLVGGVKGAQENYELDYWCNSLKAASRWINANAKQHSRIYVPAGIGRLLNLKGDLALDHVDPDYSVVLVREAIVANPYKDQEPIHIIKANGADLCLICKVKPNFNQDKIEPREKIDKLLPGVVRTIYADQNKERTISTDIVSEVYFDKSSQEFKELGLGDNFFIVWEGYLYLPEDGNYGLASSTKPESRFFLGDTLLVHNILKGRIWEKTVRKRLKKGYYPMRVELRGSKNIHMDLRWKLPSRYIKGNYTRIPEEHYYHKSTH